MELYNPAISYNTAHRIEVHTAADISAVLSSGDSTATDCSICNTGHGFHAQSESVSRVIDLSHMRSVEKIDNGRIRVEAGALWRDVSAVVPQGRRVVPGSFPGVGVCGYLSGSGVGPDVRLVGPSARFVDSLEVVDRQGNIIPCSKEENSDIFEESLLTKGSRFVIVSANITTIDDALLRCVKTTVSEDEIGHGGISRFIQHWMNISGKYAHIGSSVQVMFMGGVPSVTLRAVAKQTEGEQLKSFIDTLQVDASIFDTRGSQLSTLHAEPEKSPGSFMDGFGILSTCSPDERNHLVDELISLGYEQKFFGVEFRHLDIPKTHLDDTLPSSLWRDVSFIVQHGSLAVDPVNANEIAYNLLAANTRRELPNFSRSLEQPEKMDQLIRSLR